MRTLKEGFFGNIGIGKTGMIETWLKEMGIKNYTINDDAYTIDVNGDCNISFKNITELPEYIQFGTVKGDFYISNNPITTLRGCPKEVGGYFECEECNNLTTLEGAPKEVGRGFYCDYCGNLTSLEGTPNKVFGDFYCDNCDKLKSLKGAPKKVEGDFNCYECENLISLKGAPKEVGGSFNCRFCRKLTSLEGAPKTVYTFNCLDCGKEFTEDDVKKYCNVKKRIYVCGH